MNTFEINGTALRDGWGGADRFWFSLKDYKVRDAAAMAQIDRPDQISQSAYFVSIGYIPYFTVSNEEVMRAYVDTLSNPKLKTALAKIDDNDYVESFWKYYNVYPQLFDGFEGFQHEYALNKAKKWCEENSINYTVNL